MPAARSILKDFPPRRAVFLRGAKPVNGELPRRLGHLLAQSRVLLQPLRVLAPFLLRGKRKFPIPGGTKFRPGWGLGDEGIHVVTRRRFTTIAVRAQSPSRRATLTAAMSSRLIPDMRAENQERGSGGENRPIRTEMAFSRQKMG